MAFEFGKKAKRKTASETDGKTFLVQARENFAKLFAKLAAEAEDADDFGEWLTEAEQAAWDYCESLTKASYRNGLAAGRKRR